MSSKVKWLTCFGHINDLHFGFKNILYNYFEVFFLTLLKCQIFYILVYFLHIYVGYRTHSLKRIWMEGDFVLFANMPKGTSVSIPIYLENPSQIFTFKWQINDILCLTVIFCFFLVWFNSSWWNHHNPETWVFMIFRFPSKNVCFQMSIPSFNSLVPVIAKTPPALWSQ